MKYTNKENMPDFICRAIEERDKEYWREREKMPERSNYSVTQLLKPVRQVLLAKRHFGEIEKDYSDIIDSSLGSAFHALAEKGEGESDLTEIRLNYKVLNKVISGKFDFYDTKTKTLWDIKTTKKFKVKRGDYKDWETQLQIYAFLIENAGFSVEKIKVFAFLKDFYKSDKASGLTKTLNIELPYEKGKIDGLEAEEWLNRRVASLEMYAEVPDNDLPFCTDKERWAKGTWTVWKNKNKTPSKRCNSEQEAYLHIENVLLEKWPKANFRVEYDKSKAFVRCQYCDASQFCNQYKEGLRDE